MASLSMLLRRVPLFSGTLEVYHHFLPVGELISEVSERDAVFCGRMMVVDFCRVVGEFYEFPQHVWLH